MWWLIDWIRKDLSKDVPFFRSDSDCSVHLPTLSVHKQSSFPQFSRVAITPGIFPAPHSFQKDFFSDEKEDPAKSTKDIDVRLLASLPKGE